MFSFSRRQLETGWMAACQNGGHIEFARLVRRAGERPRLTEWFAESLEDVAGSDMLAGLLAAGKKHELGKYRFTTLLPAGAYHFIQTDAPSVPDAEKKAALAWQLKELVDADPERSICDLLPLPERATAMRQAQIFLAVAAHEVVAPVVQCFQQAALELTAIDLPELAQRNIAALFEEENRGLAFLVMSPAFSLLTFTCQGELFAFRRIEIGSDRMVLRR